MQPKLVIVLHVDTFKPILKAKIVAHLRASLCTTIACSLNDGMVDWADDCQSEKATVLYSESSQVSNIFCFENWLKRINMFPQSR